MHITHRYLQSFDLYFLVHFHVLQNNCPVSHFMDIYTAINRYDDTWTYRESILTMHGSGVSGWAKMFGKLQQVFMSNVCQCLKYRFWRSWNIHIKSIRMSVCLVFFFCILLTSDLDSINCYLLISLSLEIQKYHLSHILTQFNTAT